MAAPTLSPLAPRRTSTGGRGLTDVKQPVRPTTSASRQVNTALPATSGVSLAPALPTPNAPPVLQTPTNTTLLHVTTTTKPLTILTTCATHAWMGRMAFRRRGYVSRVRLVVRRVRYIWDGRCRGLTLLGLMTNWTLTAPGTRCVGTLFDVIAVLGGTHCVRGTV